MGEVQEVHSETWILNGIVCTQDDKRSVERKNIRIIDGFIDSFTNSTPPRISKTATLIDAASLTLIPGFVQAHTHLCQTLFRNQADDLELLEWLSKRIWVMEGAHTEETLHASASLGIHEMLSSGTTCILDMGTVRHTHVIFEAARNLGIRASIGKCLMDDPERTPVTLRDSTRDALSEATQLFQNWNGKENDRLRFSYAPRFALSCTQDLLRQVAILAKEQNAIIHTHASENQKEVELVKTLSGLENIEYLHRLSLTSPRLVLAHCVWLNSEEKEILRSTGTHVTHCPSANLKLASGIAPIPELRSLGINVALGADGAACNNNLNMFQEMRFAALIHKPGSGPKTMRAMEVFDMATRNGAKALQWFDQIGTLEVGKKADIAALNLQNITNLIPSLDELNPESIASSIVYACQPKDVKWTLVDGKIVYRDGVVTGITASRLLSEVRKAQETIRRKTTQTGL